MKRQRQSRYRVFGSATNFTTLINQFRRAYSYSLRSRIVNSAKQNGMNIELEYQNGFIAHLKSGNETIMIDIRESTPKSKEEIVPKISMKRQSKIKLT